jgi:hypothetical protein
MAGDFDLNPADYAEDAAQDHAPKELALRDETALRSGQFAPGSQVARERGCTCPRIDNAYGLGIESSLVQRLWWFDSACPYHVPLAAPAEPRE